MKERGVVLKDVCRMVTPGTLRQVEHPTFKAMRSDGCPPCFQQYSSMAATKACSNTYFWKGISLILCIPKIHLQPLYLKTEKVA